MTDLTYRGLVARTREEQRAALHVNTVADEALAIIDGPRKDTYGDPVENLGRIGQMWGVILNREITNTEVALMMVATKLARESGPGAHHRDNLVDAVGYLLIAERCQA
jgi:hypothetical protein